MNKRATARSAVPSLVHESEGQDPCGPPYSTRVIGQEVWKAEALLTATGVSIGYIQRRKRALLGFAMGYVKDDDSTIEYQPRQPASRSVLHNISNNRLPTAADMDMLDRNPLMSALPEFP